MLRSHAALAANSQIMFEITSVSVLVEVVFDVPCIH